MLSKEELRNRHVQLKRRYKLVPLFDGSQIRLQSLTRAEQRAWRKATQKKDGTPDPAKIDFSNDILLAMTIVDEAGEPVFTSDQALLGIFDHWDTEDTTVLIDAAVEHCGLAADEKEVKARLKNSEMTRGNDSSGGNASVLELPKVSSTSDSTMSTS